MSRFHVDNGIARRSSCLGEAFGAAWVCEGGSLNLYTQRLSASGFFTFHVSRFTPQLDSTDIPA